MAPTPPPSTAQGSAQEHRPSTSASSPSAPPDGPGHGGGHGDGNDADRHDEGGKRESQLRGLNPVGLIAGGGAAATVSVLGGYLGTAGTVVGAFLTSIASATAIAVYTDSLEGGKRVLRKARRIADEHPATGNSAQGSATWTTAPPTATEDRRSTADPESLSASVPEGEDTAEPEDTADEPRSLRRRVVTIVLLSLGILVIAMGAVFGIQKVTGVDLSPGTGNVQRSVTGSDHIRTTTRSDPTDEPSSETEVTEDSETGSVTDPTTSPTEAPTTTDDSATTTEESASSSSTSTPSSTPTTETTTDSTESETSEATEDAGTAGAQDDSSDDSTDSDTSSDTTSGNS